MISIKKLNKKFGRLHVLRDFNVEFDAGKSYALMGPNGSGKTTLIKSILGLVLPDSGEITLQGQAIRKEWKYRSHIGYMPQIGRYPDHMTIGQLFRMMQDMRPEVKQYDESLVADFGLDLILDKAMHTLSGGTRQKVSAALAFMFNPQIYILDEPTAGLDPLAVEVLKRKINVERKKGKLIIITSHVLSDLDELTTHAVYMVDGSIFYNNSIAALKEETGEERFSSAIARLMEWTVSNELVEDLKQL
jgi:Cu-processing system ATP-binding protein